MHTVMASYQREEVASVVREKRRQRTSCNEDRPMQQETTMSQWRSGGVRRLQAAVRREGGMGMLVVALLLPLTAAGQDMPEALVFSDSDEAVEALAATAPHEGDLDTSFGGDGKVTSNFGLGGSVRAVAIQPDGKIIVFGTSSISNDLDFALAISFAILD
jgi:hypothetical protein